MKAIITFLFLVMSVLSYSQSEKYFNYKISKFSRLQIDSNYFVTPRFEENPCKRGDGGLFTPKTSAGVYVRKFVNSVTIAVLRDTVEMLAYRSGKDSKASWARVTLDINEEGNIQYVNFSITKNDKRYLSDALLYELYKKFKEAKFDMSVGTFESKDGRAPTGKYFTLILPLYTKIFRDKTL